MFVVICLKKVEAHMNIFFVIKVEICSSSGHKGLPSPPWVLLNHVGCGVVEWLAYFDNVVQSVKGEYSVNVVQFVLNAC